MSHHWEIETHLFHSFLQVSQVHVFSHLLHIEERHDEKIIFVREFSFSLNLALFWIDKEGEGATYSCKLHAHQYTYNIYPVTSRIELAFDNVKWVILLIVSICVSETTYSCVLSHALSTSGMSAFKYLLLKAWMWLFF